MIFLFGWTDPFWMPYPDLNWPAGAFYMNVLATVCSGGCAVLLVERVLKDRVRIEQNEGEFKMVPDVAETAEPAEESKAMGIGMTAYHTGQSGGALGWSTRQLPTAAGAASQSLFPSEKSRSVEHFAAGGAQA